MGDTILRQAAIDDAKEMFKKNPTIAIRVMDLIKSMPSAQPEIVRCKDCKDYQDGVDINGKPFSRCNGSVRTYGHTMPDWYCADAERRER